MSYSSLRPERGIAPGLYFSHVDCYDADLRSMERHGIKLIDPKVYNDDIHLRPTRYEQAVVRPQRALHFPRLV